MDRSPPETYDIIIVGGEHPRSSHFASAKNHPLAGPAGATLASHLARSAAHPSILLVEAGGANDSKSMTIDAERWLHRFSPDHNWGYRSVPQEHLDGSVLAYDRGKGIGGSSSINFCR